MSRQRIFRLPAEHGAVVVLALSSILGATLGSSMSQSIAAQVVLWLAIGTCHDKRTALLAILAGSIIAAACANWLMILPALAVVLGNQILRNNSFGGNSRLVREIAGMAAAAVLPILAAALASADMEQALRVATLMLGATFACSFAVHLATGSMNSTSRILGIIACLAFARAGQDNLTLTLLVIAPFLIEILIAKSLLSRLPLKKIGIIQACSICWATAILLSQT
ncbi:MAG: hypothetical protein IPM23_07085 [Candidatus Melainabacteria bacterium]|nr:hypothetical protein [Candidatus Melainabacteria bacterium]